MGNANGVILHSERERESSVNGRRSVRSTRTLSNLGRQVRSTARSQTARASRKSKSFDQTEGGRPEKWSLVGENPGEDDKTEAYAMQPKAFFQVRRHWCLLALWALTCPPLPS